MLERGIHAGVGRQGAAPVALQRQQALREGVRGAAADEVAGVLAEDLLHVGVGVPAERAPDELVHVVIAAFRIGEEADGVGRGSAEDGGLVHGPRVDGLAGFGDGIGHVPIGHRILRLAAVGDVGIVADGVAGGHGRAQLGQVHAHLRPEHHAAEPGRLLVAENGQELVHPRLYRSSAATPTSAPRGW